MAHDDLIRAAAAVLSPHTTPDGRLFGDVACALIADDETVYRGVCIDTGSGTGFCAEHAAIAAMVTAGRYVITSIVAVWRGPEDGRLHVVPPCGRCRQFILQVDPRNRATTVVLGRSRSARLDELLPERGWPPVLEGDW